jgi:two-component system cell cycle response regulator DivK
VEDNVLNFELIKDILEMENYEISSAVNGKEALEILKAQDYDLVLTDIHLPEMDGLELLKHVRAETNQSAKMIAMTADMLTKDGKAYEEAGFDGFIQKPFKIKDLRDYVKSQLSNPNC